jgi:uncharacterized protein (TIGR02391 family)
MNLQTIIGQELWHAISRSYLSQAYCNAILDSIHYLSDIIRDKSGVDGDGVPLVGQAFGGDTPRIRINKLQTQSERDEQKGLADLLRGIYTGIRNTRSHEQIEDSKDTADSIIIFINYLLTIIEESKVSFTIEQWLDRVFDPDFVPNARYAQVIVAEIPPRKRIDALLTLYRNKMEGDSTHIRLTFEALISVIGQDNLGELSRAASEELRVIRNEEVIAKAIDCLPAEIWPLITEDARLRIENKLIQSIKAGKIYKNGDQPARNVVTKASILGTKANRIVDYFVLKHELSEMFFSLLIQGEGEMLYILAYFGRNLPKIIRFSESAETEELVLEFLCTAINRHDSIRDKIASLINTYPSEWSEYITNTVGERIISDDDIPF